MDLNIGLLQRICIWSMFMKMQILREHWILIKVNFWCSVKSWAEQFEMFLWDLHWRGKEVENSQNFSGRHCIAWVEFIVVLTKFFGCQMASHYNTRSSLRDIVLDMDDDEIIDTKRRINNEKVIFSFSILLGLIFSLCRSLSLWLLMW